MIAMRRNGKGEGGGRRRAATLLALATPVIMLGCSESPFEPPEAVAQTATQELSNGDPQARVRGPGGHVLALREQLGLTNAQAEEIEGILEELATGNAPLLEQLRPAEGGPRRRPDETARDLFEQIRANTRAAQERIQAVLTDEQRTLMSELRPPRDAHERPDRDGRRGGRGPGMPEGASLDLLRLREQLSLTEDQIARLRGIRDELVSENRTLLEQLRESGERPRGGDAAQNPLLQQLRANAQAAGEEMLGVLTDAQRATLEELRGTRPEGPMQGLHRPAGPRR
jgi:hypothetical protein